jgi:hypothetical protein
MNKIILVAVIIAAVGVTVITGIVSYNFARQLMAEQEVKQAEIDSRQRALLQEEFSERQDAYFDDLMKCNPNRVSSNSLNASEKLAMKQCADNAWESNGLTEKKFEVFR